MVKLVLIVLAGAGLGAWLGSTRSCETGGCPLTSTPWRGAVYGAFLAGLLGFAFVGRTGGRSESPKELSANLLAIESAADFEAQVVQAQGPVLVDFYADWCGPCRSLLPVISEIADEWAGVAKVVKVNVDKVGDVAQAHGVSSIPDVRFFLAGKEQDRLIGRQDKQAYTERLTRLKDQAAGTPAPARAPATAVEAPAPGTPPAAQDK